MVYFKKLINEALNTIKDLNPNIKDGQIPPSLLTWSEYYKIVNSDDNFHGSDAYNYPYDENDKLDLTKVNLIKNKVINTIHLKFYLKKEERQYTKWDGDTYVGTYSKDEMKKMGIDPYIYTIYCTHNGVRVGMAVDEWGCVLVSVVKEFKNLGIGEELIKIYRKIYPYKPSGGFTESGLVQIRKYYNYMVRTTLANGIYSQMVRDGEITMERVKEIINSVNKKYSFSDNKKNKLKDAFKGDRFSPVMIISTNSVIIFDSNIIKIIDEDFETMHSKILREYIYCYIHVVDMKGYPQIYDAYGDKKYLNFGLQIIANENKTEGGVGDFYFRTFDTNLKNDLYDILNSDIFSKTTYDKLGYISGVPLNIYRLNKNIDSKVSDFKLHEKMWFKHHDRFNELRDKIEEIAYGLTQ